MVLPLYGRQSQTSGQSIAVQSVCEIGEERTSVEAIDEREYVQIREFLHREAELMDNGQWEAWLELLTEDVRYRMPLRITRYDSAGGSIEQGMSHLDEDRATLTMRVRRLRTDSAWAEDPPSRTRHFISNLRVESGPHADEVVAKSNVLLYRSRGDVPTYDLLSAERHDRLRKVDGGWRLAERTVYLDHSPVMTHNLAVLF
jgi:3-phenylpropionate/cinnamic acid dioxygenase small subunit